MGGKNSKQRDLLEGSAWLRTVVQHYQRRRQGVAGFDSFTIEPVFTPKNQNGNYPENSKTDENDVRLFRVDISFRNNKGTAQEVYWIVKAAYVTHSANDMEVIKVTECRSVDRLLHETKVYTSLLLDIGKFLESRKNPRAKFLLNIPTLVFHERAQQSGRIVRCHLVVEDVSRTKRCSPIGNIRSERGMTLSQFKVFLGTLAQFHAVGMSWNSAKKDDSALDLFPFLHREPRSSCQNKARRDVLLGRYEKLLLWYFGQKDRSEARLFYELKKHCDEILATNLQSDMCNPLGGLCLGNLLPGEVMFQYETTFASLFDLCRSGFDEKKWRSPDNCDDDLKRSPACAGVTTCHRVHFGHLLRELATAFYIMPQPLIRQRYLIFMLQSYCHVLTITMEMLEVDWNRHFKMTFHQVVLEFFRQIPQAVLRGIIAHMKLTDPDELSQLVSKDNQPNQNPVREDNEDDAAWRRKTIPLTPARIEFLIGLLNPVPKSV